MRRPALVSWIMFGTVFLATCARSIPPVPGSGPTPVSSPTATGPSFTAAIQPLFTERCIKCHSGDDPPRGLRLDSYDSVLAGGTYRPVVIPGNPAESEITRRIKGESTPRMPFDGPPFLSAAEIASIEAWIAAGASDN